MKKNLNTNLVQFPLVTIRGFGYEVILGAMDTYRHFVSKDKTCGCGAQECPAIREVLRFLLEGGQRAPDLPTGYVLRLPPTCPVCGAGTQTCLRLSSPRRGLGWECATHGKSHYWQHQGNLMANRVRADKAAGRFVSLPDVQVPFGYLPEANRCVIVKGGWYD